MHRIEPLVELHLHLDGSLRLGTMLDIAHEEGVDLPAGDKGSLYKALRCGTVRESLADYLGAFGVTVSVMQSERALMRIAEELIEDAAADGLCYVEVRFMPSLHTQRGLLETEVIEAVLEGLRRGGEAHHVEWGLIVCSMRHVDPSETARLMDLAVTYKDDGVVAVDMAGDDLNFPATAHAEHFRRAKRAGLGVTVHAAEAGPPARAHDALELFCADRLGHGIRIGENTRLADKIGRLGIPLEVCPTSNVQIKQVASYEAHPAREYLRQGHRVTINTDNRMLADTTMRKELEIVRKAWQLEDKDVKKLIWNAIRASFASDWTKELLFRRLEKNFTPVA